MHLNLTKICISSKMHLTNSFYFSDIIMYHLLYHWIAILHAVNSNTSFDILCILPIHVLKFCNLSGCIIFLYILVLYKSINYHYKMQPRASEIWRHFTGEWFYTKYRDPSHIWCNVDVHFERKSTSSKNLETNVFGLVICCPRNATVYIILELCCTVTWFGNNKLLTNLGYHMNNFS